MINKIKYRLDIEGLRAIAVLSVIIFHAFPRLLPGGFTGVDIFFVISGYLVIGSIQNEIKSNIFSILSFYARRFRRIFPALALVLLATWIIGNYVLLSTEFKNLSVHIFGSVGFFQNFILLSESGYFDIASDLKPLLHLWSLSIEEQFYILSPLLLVLIHRLSLSPVRIFIVLIILSL